MSVGKNIKEKREQLNLTQQELAQMAGITQAMLSAVEIGAKNPSFQVAVAIANALNCTTDDLAK